MSTLPPGFPPVVTLTAAIVFIGNVLNFWLLGILTVQAYYYYINFGRSDVKRIRFVAVFTVLLEFTQTCLVFSDAFVLFCQRWGDPTVLLRSGLIWVYIPLLGSTMSFVAQLFWAWRLRLLTQAIWLPLLIITFSLTQFIAAFIGGIAGRTIEDVTKLAIEFKPISIWVAGTAIADIIIVVAMLYFFNKNRSSFAGTSAVLSKVLFLTIETGMCCATVAILDLVMYLVWQNENWHICASIVLSKVYANSLLLVLNSRKGGKYIQSSTDGSSYQLGSRPRTNENRHGGNSGINIQVSRDQRADDNRAIPMVHMINPAESQGKIDDSYVKF
ncbi:hypothetical protein C8J56DRAFT_962171 [Mycena floridula]|nr:hypothetical protein C8J56DRAFT_962171 [Mycena floridula]